MSDISCEEESARESDDASETGSRSHPPGIPLCPRHSPPFSLVVSRVAPVVTGDSEDDEEEDDDQHDSDAADSEDGKLQDAIGDLRKEANVLASWLRRRKRRRREWCTEAVVVQQPHSSAAAAGASSSNPPRRSSRQTRPVHAYTDCGGPDCFSRCASPSFASLPHLM
jgi:hypothetical protein